MTGLKYYIFFALAILLISCSENTKKDSATDNMLTVTGRMNNGNGLLLVLQELTREGKVPLDSIKIDHDGFFEIQYPVPETGFYTLTNEGGNSITLAAGPGDSIYMNASYFNFREFELSGSKDAVLVSSLNRETQKFLEEISEFSRIVQDSAGSPAYPEIRLEIDKKYRASFERLKDFSAQLIRDNPSSLVSLLALSNQLGENFFVFHPVNDHDIFNFVDSSLSLQYPDNEAVINLHRQMQRVDSGKFSNGKNRLNTGDPAPEISLPDTAGIVHHLSGFSNNIILVVFWSSWCEECRLLNPEIKQLYETYKPEGLKLFQVSLDNSPEQWKKAIAEDRLDGLQVSDLKFWESEAVNAFFVENIPFICLINSNGQIISLNSGLDDIKIKLEQLFSPNG